MSLFKKKLWRFFNNPKFNGLDFFNASTKHIVTNLNAIKHNKLIVTIDHMYVKNNFVVLMFSLKVGSQAIHLYFKCDKTKSNRHHEIDELTKKCLFSEKVNFSAIDDVIEILSPLNIKFTFLADRWFFNFNLMKHIDHKSHYFCIRAKVNSDARFLCYDKKEKYEIYKKFTDLPIQKDNATYHSIVVGSFWFRCDLSIARDKLSDDPWFILSNIEPNKTLREYAHRFGTIETLFKNQKTKVKNLHAFENLYSLVCFACTWLVIIGADYSKSYHHAISNLNIRFVKTYKNKKIRILSLFNLGLTIFTKVYNSYINYKLKCNMQLYL